MPRFTRNAARRVRRTNWVGSPNVAFDTVAGGSAVEKVIIDMEGAWVPSQRMSDPTLTRIRGQIGVDAAVAANQTTLSKNVVLGVILYYAEASIPDIHDAEAIGAGNQKFSSDNILWTGLWGMSSEWSNFNVGVNLSEYRIGGFYPHKVWDVDVKAQRRMGDRGKIFMSISNFAGSGSQLVAAAATFYWTLRVLFKE